MWWSRYRRCQTTIANSDPITDNKCLRTSCKRLFVSAFELIYKHCLGFARVKGCLVHMWLLRYRFRKLRRFLSSASDVTR